MVSKKLKVHRVSEEQAVASAQIHGVQFRMFSHHALQKFPGAVVKAQKSDAQVLHGTQGHMYALPVSLHQVGPSHHGTYGLGKALTYSIQDVEYARI